MDPLLVTKEIEGALLQGEKAIPLNIALVVEVTIVVAVEFEPASTILTIRLFAASAVVPKTIGFAPEKSAITPLAPTMELLPVFKV